MYAHFPHRNIGPEGDVEAQGDHGLVLLKGVEVEVVLEVDNALFAGSNARVPSARRVVLLLAVVAMALATVAAIAFVLAPREKAGGEEDVPALLAKAQGEEEEDASGLLVATGIAVVLLFPAAALLGLLHWMLGVALLVTALTTLLTHGQVLWFQLLLQLHVPREAVTHVTAAYLLVMTTLTCAIIALSRPRTRLVCLRG